MGTSFMPLCAIIAVLIIAFLFASLPQVSHKTRYRVLYAIAIIMLLAVIPISEYMAENTKNSNSNYLLVLIFDVAVGYFFEEIKTALKGINGKLKELIGMVNQQPKNGNVEQDFSPIKDAIVETTKAQSEVIKGLLAKQWKAYAQISTLILQQLDTIKKSQSEQSTQQEPQPQEHIHRHSFDIKSSKVFSFVVGLGAVCALSLWGNVAQWQSNRQYADDALKFRAIRSWGGCNANDVLWLNKVFDIHRHRMGTGTGGWI